MKKIKIKCSSLTIHRVCSLIINLLIDLLDTVRVSCCLSTLLLHPIWAMKLKIIVEEVLPFPTCRQLVVALFHVRCCACSLSRGALELIQVFTYYTLHWIILHLIITVDMLVCWFNKSTQHKLVQEIRLQNTPNESISPLLNIH